MTTCYQCSGALDELGDCERCEIPASQQEEYDRLEESWSVNELIDS